METNIENINLCECGYPETDHNFRHIFNSTYILRKSINVDTKKEEYTVNALNFPQKEDSVPDICTFPQCGKGKSLHNLGLYAHEFKPRESDGILRRHISFFLPSGAKCGSCDIPMNRHIVRHIYEVPTIIVENCNKNDRVSVKIAGHESRNVVLSIPGRETTITNA